MGYLITSEDRSEGIRVSDGAWLDILQHASNHGFSAPHLRLDDYGDELYIIETDADMLREALLKALRARDIEEFGAPEGYGIDRETVLRVGRVLRSGGRTRLERERLHG